MPTTCTQANTHTKDCVVTAHRQFITIVAGYLGVWINTYHLVLVVTVFYQSLVVGGIFTIHSAMMFILGASLTKLGLLVAGWGLSDNCEGCIFICVCDINMSDY